MKIELITNHEFLSFEAGAEMSFSGELIIISGVNGGGKSQLLQLMNGEKRVPNPTSPANTVIETIPRQLLVNGDGCDSSMVQLRSFRDIRDVKTEKRPGHQILESHISQAHGYYKTYLLNPANKYCAEYKDSCIRLISVLKNTFGEQRFNSKQISIEEFRSLFVDNDFIWSKDLFANTLNAIFLNYALQLQEKQANAFREGQNGKDVSLKVDEPPWTILNRQLEAMKIQYRFKETYETSGITLKEEPALYRLDSSGARLESKRFDFDVLSDGEKAILSLCFAVLNCEDNENIKLLLLDEFDAVLNPTLVTAFFRVLDDVFLKNGVVVMLATHSVATLALAPENANFYQINRPESAQARVEKIDRDSYGELEVALGTYFTKLEHLEGLVHSYQSSAVRTDQPRIITEGKTDWRHYVALLKHFHEKGKYKLIDADYFLRFGSEEDVKSTVCGTSEYYEMGDGELNSHLKAAISARVTNNISEHPILLGLFDSDNKDLKTKQNKQCSVLALVITEPKSSIEQLYPKEFYLQEVGGRRMYLGTEFLDSNCHRDSPELRCGASTARKIGKSVVIDKDIYNSSGKNIALSKSEFANAIYDGKIDISKTDLSKFENELNKIEKVLSGEYE